jgi:hypothetical protein
MEMQSAETEKTKEVDLDHDPTPVIPLTDGYSYHASTFPPLFARPSSRDFLIEIQ